MSENTSLMKIHSIYCVVMKQNAIRKESMYMVKYCINSCQSALCKIKVTA